jgi:uncharacterized protein (DUF4415 family)
MSRKPAPSMLDDDSPEWTAEDFARARPIQVADPSMLEAVAGYRRRDRTMAKPLTDERGEVRELTAEGMKRFRPIREADPGMPEAGAAFRRRGRPPVESPKVRVGFRLAADVVAGIRATGRGYNARVERVLRETLAEERL